MAGADIQCRVAVNENTGQGSAAGPVCLFPETCATFACERQCFQPLRSVTLKRTRKPALGPSTLASCRCRCRPANDATPCLPHLSLFFHHRATPARQHCNSQQKTQHCNTDVAVLFCTLARPQGSRQLLGSNARAGCGALLQPFVSL